MHYYPDLLHFYGRLNFLAVEEYVRHVGSTPPNVTDAELQQEWSRNTDARELFVLASVGMPFRTWLPTACACARLAVAAVSPTSPVVEQAIDVVEAWLRGEVTVAEVQVAQDAAVAAYHAGGSDSSFADEAQSSLIMAVMGLTAGDPVGVALFAANTLGCSTMPGDRDDMRDARSAALERFADLIRSQLTCPTLDALRRYEEWL